MTEVLFAEQIDIKRSGKAATENRMHIDHFWNEKIQYADAVCSLLNDNISVEKWEKRYSIGRKSRMGVFEHV